MTLLEDFMYCLPAIRYIAEMVLFPWALALILGGIVSLTVWLYNKKEK